MMYWLFLLALSLGPCVAVMFYIYMRDKHEPEPVWLVVKTFFVGCLSVIPPIFLQILAHKYGIGTGREVYYVLIHAFLVVALSEEISKFLLLRVYSYPKKEFDEPYDGIVYSVMIAMGFAAVENVWYIFSEPNLLNQITVAMLRLFTAIPAHATFGIIMGYYMGLAKCNPQQKMINLTKAFVFPVLFHGLYDFFLMQNEHTAIALGALVSLVVAIRLSKKAIRLHCDISPFREEAVEEAPASQLPEPEDGTAKATGAAEAA